MDSKISPPTGFFPRLLPGTQLPFEYFDTETKMILQEADQQAISWSLIEDSDIILLEKDAHKHYIWSRLPDTTSALAIRACRDKSLTKKFLQKAKISTPNGYTLFQKDSEVIITSAFEALQKPVVIKPTHGTHGKAIHTNITDLKICLNLIQNYFDQPQFEGGLILEEQFTGREHRIIASREKIIAVVERVPANVVGDGQKTIQELIAESNAQPFRNISQDLYPHIKIDDDLLKNLQNESLTLESIPEKNQKVSLRTVSNVMAGGEAIDRTDEIHPSVGQIVQQIFAAIPGLSWCGIDYMTQDISKEQTSSTYTVIELGEMPEFAMHDIPMKGIKRDVTKAFLALMFQ